MNSPTLWRLLADAVLLVHAAIVVGVVGGLVLIVAGALRHWKWVRLRWLRVLHLATIAIVAGQSWFGLVCPLTTAERELRTRAGDAVYAGDFVAHWVRVLLYYEGPAWAFALAYTLFGLAVLGTWILVPPYRRGSSIRRGHDRPDLHRG